MAEQQVRQPRAMIWQLVLPVLWIGVVFAISFIEAPLKFQAPGITIPLGLGIGRLVFTALNAVELLLALALIVVSFWPRVTALAAGLKGLLLSIVIVLVLKVSVVRPPLNARTNEVLAGADPGQSPWHYIYIALDLVLLALLVIFVVRQSGRILARMGGPTPSKSEPSAG
ncbi:hypothetical protein [Leucobacter chinensis]|uniref:hypothetical protein n=1 Tax=Leucobacter chinensis TaxID=2851010 RepID=UPI001C2472C4|nr:hypothetical protein [Leucobacter chinensis]